MRNIQTAVSPHRNIQTAVSPPHNIQTAVSPHRNIQTAVSPHPLKIGNMFILTYLLGIIHNTTPKMFTIPPETPCILCHIG
jgi:hypothetical protein